MFVSHWERKYRMIKKTLCTWRLQYKIVDLKMAITEYIWNVDRAILNTVFENTEWFVNKCVETGTLYNVALLRNALFYN
jgi:hypothetical protein